jgi:hypothetical protein
MQMIGARATVAEQLAAAAHWAAVTPDDTHAHRLHAHMLHLAGQHAAALVACDAGDATAVEPPFYSDDLLTYAEVRGWALLALDRADDALAHCRAVVLDETVPMRADEHDYVALYAASQLAVGRHDAHVCDNARHGWALARRANERTDASGAAAAALARAAATARGGGDAGRLLSEALTTWLRDDDEVHTCVRGER